jgi:hypothetical protein
MLKPAEPRNGAWNADQQGRLLVSPRFHGSPKQTRRICREALERTRAAVEIHRHAARRCILQTDYQSRSALFGRWM